MKAIIKTNFSFLFIFIALSSCAYSQLSLEQMISIKLGETFANSKQEIKSLFAQKAQVMRADFFGAYRIEYENVPLDYYGDAYFTFQYAKDTLVAVKVEFTFLAPDTIKFRRLYNTLVPDLNGDKTKLLLKKYSNLSAPKIFQYINAHCITTTQKEDKNYQPIKTAFLGENYWAIVNNQSNVGKYLRMYIQLSEIHKSNIENNRVTRYDGCGVTLALEFTSERFQDLKIKEEKMEISNYKSVNEPDQQIKLKFQNGLYFVPIKINNTLAMDFVLDLGASDVLISPDVFLVLYKAGTIQDNDFIGSQTYQFADGTSVKSNIFNIKAIQIGDKEIKNVRAAIGNSLNAPLLLGQSALKKLGRYRIDNYQRLLVIE